MSDRDLCDGLITRPEEFYRLWSVVVCDLEKNLVNEEAKTHWGATAPPQKINKINKYEGWNFNSGNYLFTTDTK